MRLIVQTRTPTYCYSWNTRPSWNRNASQRLWQHTWRLSEHRRTVSQWVECKEANHYETFCPTLEECFDTSMQVADKKRGDRTHSLYTQMLDEFEMGMSQQRIDDIFGTIQEALVPLIAKVLASETQPSTLPLKGHFEIAAQKKFCQDIVTKLGYNLDQGRIDVSVHPFTMSFSTNDVRITSRFKTDEWYQGLAATIHEGGWTCHVRTIGRRFVDESRCCPEHGHT